MKKFSVLLLFLVSFNVSSSTERFRALSIAEMEESYTSYEDEVIVIGGMSMTRRQLTESSNLPPVDVTIASDDSIFNDPVFSNAINISLAATIIHTVVNADEDKKKHAFVGAVIGAATVKICERILSKRNHKLICALSGAGASLLAGVAKEVYDSNGHGTVDVNDALYTFVPGALISFSLEL